MGGTGLDTGFGSVGKNAGFGTGGGEGDTKTSNSSSLRAVQFGSTEVRSWAFTLRPGEFYVLSGPARNKCCHGVVCLEDDDFPGFDKGGRQSLNLRFGVHSEQQAYDEVDRHWG
mmetsp:Transcript_19143/g.42742  ORF Transcript_19143/g.42742 Transcript_19143/m.42742 type:complete len:114 (-) Transcript_19143:30-371(-)